MLAGVGCTPDSSPNNHPAEQPKSTPETHAQSKIRFREVTDDSGINSTYRNGREANRYSILESLGGGTGALDFDRDGRLDLCFTGGGGFESDSIVGLPTRLFRNLTGQTFADVSRHAKLAAPDTYTQGCSFCDIDCDGFPDMLVTGYAGLQLFMNAGDGTFHEVAKTSGLTDALWSSSAAWGDLNGDGWPDLYVAHYADWSTENDPVCPSPWPEHDRDVCPPRAFKPLPDVLYFSRGDGTFVNTSQQAGLRDDGKGLGAITADLDHDGDLDIYVANDMVDNFLYLNDGHGNFTEAGLLSGTATDFEGRPNGSMGLAVCDYNGDLFPDLWVTNFEQETFGLYRNDGNANFVHASREAGITAIGQLFVGFGTAMGDLDCDGDEDCMISNGHVVYYPTVSGERQQPVLLENTGDGRFVSVGQSAGDYFTEPHLGRGLILADLNNDGRLDAVAGHSNEPASVLLNETSLKDRTWLSIRLIGTVSSRDAVGTRVVLETTDGKQLRHVVGGGSFQSQNDLRVHFGIAKNAQVLSVTIYWASGITQVLKEPATSTTIEVVERAAQN